MKAKKYLFVGGPSDGHRKPDPTSYGHILKIAVFPPWDNSTAHPLDAADCVGTQVHTYTRKKFRDETGKEYEVYFHDSIQNPMEALIKGYRYHRNKQCKKRCYPKKYFKGTPPYTFQKVPDHLAPRFDIVPKTFR